MTTYKTVQAHWDNVYNAARSMSPADTARTDRNTGIAAKNGTQWRVFHDYLFTLQNGKCATCGQKMRLARERSDDASGLFLAVPAGCYTRAQNARVGHVEGVHVVSCQSCRERITQTLTARNLAIPASAIVLTWSPEMFKMPKKQNASKHSDECVRILRAKGYDV